MLAVASIRRTLRDPLAGRGIGIPRDNLAGPEIVWRTLETGPSSHSHDDSGSSHEPSSESPARLVAKSRGWKTTLVRFADIGITISGERNETARAYVVFGASDLPRTIQLSRLGTRGFRLTGVEGSWLSTQNEGIAAGDLDGDGVMDLALGMAYPEDGVSKRRAFVIFGKNPAGGQFIRGDADGNGALNITDPVLSLGQLFLGEPASGCEDSLDSDDSGTLSITDPIYTLEHLFRGGPAPLPPHPERGPDPTPDALECSP